MSVIFQKFDDKPGKWHEIEYAHYCDFARLFYVKYKNIHLVFDAPFLDIQDEYAFHFIVYMSHVLDSDWKNFYSKWKISNIVHYENIVFDETRKKYILTRSLDEMFKNYDLA